jgi:hypothetical protein
MVVDSFGPPVLPNGKPAPPSFLPPYPPEYTYDDTIAEPTVVEDVELTIRRERDQSKIKEEIGPMLMKHSRKTGEDDISLKCELVVPPVHDQRCTWPTRMLGTPVMVMDGKRTEADPEFLPALKTEELGVPQTRDAKLLYGILAIRHPPNDVGRVEREKAQQAG